MNNGAADLAERNEIDIAELADFTEDPEARRAFECQYRPFVLPPLLLCAVSFFMAFATGQASWLAAFAAGLGLLVIVCWIAARGTPRSRFTGRPMLRLRRSDAPQGTLEMIYIDFDNRTYFRRVIFRIQKTRGRRTGGWR